VAQSSLLSVAALIISVLAVAAGAMIGIRQTASARHANHIAVLVDLMNEFRTRQFNQDHDYICERLATEHDPQLGISGLPENAGDAFYSVTYFYQILGVLVVLKILDRDDIITIYQRRLIILWKAVQPYVIRERELKGGSNSYLLLNLEALATAASQFPPDSLNALLERSLKVKLGRSDQHIP
jgi:hypothetical protein